MKKRIALYCSLLLAAGLAPACWVIVVPLFSNTRAVSNGIHWKLSPEELVELEEKAMAGDSHAAGTLGSYYDFKQNKTKAYEWYIYAATRGNCASIFTMKDIDQDKKSDLKKWTGLEAKYKCTFENTYMSH